MLRAAWYFLGAALVAAQSTRPWDSTEPFPVDTRMPPFGERASNPVKVSIRLSDLASFDEANERLAVYAVVFLEWPDQRWFNASVKLVNDICTSSGGCSTEDFQRALQWGEGWIKGIFGQTANSFFRAVRSFGENVGFVISEDVWTPIPPHLFLKTSNNPLGKTEFDPVIYMVPKNSSTFFEAVWLDRARTFFDVILSYEHFPFDQQSLDLCLNFDYFTLPAHASVSEDLVKRLAERWDSASDISSILSSKFVAGMEGQGFEVVSVDVREKVASEMGSALCINIKIQRRVSILILRFFWPLTALLFIPFAGFFIPIELVMPRVATGFISFLSLQVFRTMAYTMIPKKSSSLLWMDVTMFSVTVIMFASVLENVLAQAMRANVSSLAARYVDNLSRVTFPLVATLMLMIVFFMGGAKADAMLNFTVCLLLLSFWLLGFATAVVVYVRRLPHMLMKTLVKQIVHTDFRYASVLSMDQKELTLVFKQLDAAGLPWNKV
ncbi:unnamed protein product [Symbiodinium natans]|uniref:Neurotransmitter-gated ion-channel ligand-binding domain-containing protein n=1 Tax=Symbiodinium natans TaxID=878477 RepID=A0A812KBW1_9DINO|nr:unnamed protein product [Symbiodinium natans]